MIPPGLWDSKKFRVSKLEQIVSLRLFLACFIEESTADQLIFLND